MLGSLDCIIRYKDQRDLLHLGITFGGADLPMFLTVFASVVANCQ
jgi:hypothetical protein